MSEATRQVALLSDAELFKYLTAVNLKWIYSVRELATKKIGTVTWRESFLRQKAIIKVYKDAVSEAVSRGILLFH